MFLDPLVNKVEGKTLERYFLGNHVVGETVAQQRRVFPGGLFLSAAVLAAEFAFLFAFIKVS